MAHIPVLLSEVIEWLAPQPGQVFVDGTLGAGGHSAAILEKISPNGHLYGFDADKSALEMASVNLSAFGNFSAVHSNYELMKEGLSDFGVSKVDGILLDIGVSSMQLDQKDRGFSFRDEMEAGLDMRMNREGGQSARDFVNNASQKEIENVIRDFGEERFWRRVAEAIVDSRKKKIIETTLELAEIVREAVPGKKGKIDKATRTFQAIRIHVNRELEVLKNVLPVGLNLLQPGGRMAVISFHSLEDRIVKWLFREYHQTGLGKILTKKPIIATDAECRMNPRSRSAKLRVMERV